MLCIFDLNMMNKYDEDEEQVVLSPFSTHTRTDRKWSDCWTGSPATAEHVVIGRPAGGSVLLLLVSEVNVSVKFSGRRKRKTRRGRKAATDRSAGPE